MRISLFVIGLLVMAGAAFAQETTESASLPSVRIKNIAGDLINTADLGNTDQPVVLSFWATWCKPCIQELQTYHSILEEWQEAYNVRIVAVSIDDSRNARKVPAFVKGRTWTFDVLLDENQDFKRAMNVNNVPHTFIVHKGKVVWSHSAFAPGDEEEIATQLSKIVSAK
jgi:cytochrome c biogenesis protein CcmG, thiol:disulfide interchange protein DsbE